jgi:uncharacterized glyoxalase superfamily protein PhnB
MKDIPEDWPRISSALYYEDAGKAIEWLCRVFGFELRLKVEGENERIEHSELMFGEGLIMVGSAGRPDRPDRSFCASPRTLGGGNTQSFCVYVDDVDARCAKARAAGARIVTEPKTDDYGEEYGSRRTYEAIDLEGHHWWFVRQTREPKNGGR